MYNLGDLYKNGKLTKEQIYELLQRMNTTNNVDEWASIKDLLVKEKTFKKKSFSHRILQHPEYALNVNVKNPNNTMFILSRNQRFVKKFMSPNTRNQSILLYHGVGVGKTCTAIHVAEPMKHINSSKTIVLAAKNLRSNFQNNLFDVTRRNDDSYDSCVGKEYINKIPNHEKMSNEQFTKEVKKQINTFYKFSSYGKFASNLSKKKDILSLDMYSRYISDTFSNSVMIVDEIQNVRENPKLDKKISDILEDISSYSTNVKLIYLSATPMFNEANEILWLMNTLMINDNEKSTKINQNELFENGIIKPNIESKIRRFANNYVSFVRGESPNDFPARIWPNINKNDPNILQRRDYPTLDVYGNTIESLDILNNICIVKSDFDEEQYKAYMRYPFAGTNDKNDTEKDTNENTARKLISNAYYPIEKNEYGKEGYKNVFNEEIVKSSVTKITIKEGYDEIFSPEHIHKYAPKIKTIIDYVQKSTGIVILYSQYLAGGLIPMALALEAHGYNQYEKKNFWKKTNENKGNYVILSGEAKYTQQSIKHINNLVSLSKDVDNRHGDKLKIYLISSKMAEGHDFGNVREIHILEPWHNLNRIEQVIGRGVRKYSHYNLPKKMRNTTIYLHANMINKYDDKESVDFRMYRQSMEKQMQISIVERILKESAIDCNLNTQYAYYDPNKNKTDIITSQGVKMKDYPLGDTEFSKLCDYQSCQYTCNPDLPELIDRVEDNSDENVNVHMIEYEIDLYIQNILDIFKRDKVYFLKYEEIAKYFSHKNVLKHALNKLIKDKPQLTIDNVKGYIIYRSNKYIFKPYALKDYKTVLFVKDELNKTKHSSVNLMKVQKNKTVGSYINPIPNKYKEILKIIKHFMKDDETVNEKIIYDIVVDELTIKDHIDFIGDSISKNRKIKPPELIQSMKDSGLFYFDENDKITHYFDWLQYPKQDKNDSKQQILYKVNESNQLQQAPGIELEEDRKRFENEYSSYVKETLIEGFVDMKEKSNSVQFKIVKEQKKDKNSLPNGTVCEYNNAKFDNLINDFIMKHQPDFEKSNVQKKVLNKKNICLYYQYLLRLQGKFLRPRFWNLYKEIVRKEKESNNKKKTPKNKIKKN